MHMSHDNTRCQECVVIPHGYFISTVTSFKYLQFGHTQPMDEAKTKIQTVLQGDQIIRGRGGKTNKYPVAYRLGEDTESTLLLLSLSNSSIV